MAFDTTRRHFFLGSLLAGTVPAAGFGSVPSLRALGYRSPNEKLNIASIGAGGRASSDIQGVSDENIVALCDVDQDRAAGTFQAFPNAATYKDFRRMLDTEGDNIDAVTIAIPDHMHATAAMWCMERGKHVYVEKPLTRTVWEAQQLRLGAEKYGVATQMGNQGYSNEGTRQLAEMIWAGEIGDVREVHAWTDRPLWPQGLNAVPSPDPVPDTLEWDLWLGGSTARPFTVGGEGYPTRYGNFYQPFNWRGFYDFGCGALGDMACHILGAPNLALQLGQPTSVECLMKEGTSEFMFPERSIVRYDFPARGSMPPVSVYWYDGLEETPTIQRVPEGEILGDPPSLPRSGNQDDAPPPNGFVGEVFDWERWEAIQNNPDARMPNPDGSLFIGDRGMITTGTYGENTRLIPVEQMRDYEFPPSYLTRSPNHHRDWIRACKGGDRSCSDFSVAAPFCEWMLLGVIALRVEGRLEWSESLGRFTNSEAANRYLKPQFREGWEFPAV